MKVIRNLMLVHTNLSLPLRYKHQYIHTHKFLNGCSYSPILTHTRTHTSPVSPSSSVFVLSAWPRHWQHIKDAYWNQSLSTRADATAPKTWLSTKVAILLFIYQMQNGNVTQRVAGEP